MDDDGDLRFLRETVIVGADFSAPGAVEADSRFRLADWFGVFGSVYYDKFIRVGKLLRSFATYGALSRIASWVCNMIIWKFDGP